MKLIILIVCYIGFIQAGTSQLNLNKVEDILSASKDIESGIVSNADKFIPTPTALVQNLKNIIAGYPLEVVFWLINAFCSAAVSTNGIKPKILPDISKMAFQFRTPCKNYSLPVLQASEMWKIPEFDRTKQTVILVTGWTTSLNETSSIAQMAQAYHCRGGVNFIVVDVASYADTLYTWSALNTELIGKYIGQGLVQLSQIIPVENIHLIGHSLGAQIVGSAGRSFNNLTDKLIPRITGLDPANPCFNEGENLAGLLRGDAKFIDVIHTNPGVMAKRNPLGDVDFYPGGMNPLPKGCLSVSCAHARAMGYFIETVYPGNENNLMGVRCTSLTKLQNKECGGRSYPMGYATPANLKGNYFLDVNGESPFGLGGNKARDKLNKDCGLCPKNAATKINKSFLRYY